MGDPYVGQSHPTWKVNSYVKRSIEMSANELVTPGPDKPIVKSVKITSVQNESNEALCSKQSTIRDMEMS